MNEDLPHVRRAADGTPWPVSDCPACGKSIDSSQLNAGKHPDGDGPAPGDLTVCDGCGMFLAYTDERRLRLLSQQETLELDGDTRAQMARMRKLIRALGD